MESNISGIKNDSQIQIKNLNKNKFYGGITHDTKYNRKGKPNNTNK